MSFHYPETDSLEKMIDYVEKVEKSRLRDVLQELLDKTDYQVLMRFPGESALAPRFWPETGLPTPKSRNLMRPLLAKSKIESRSAPPIACKKMGIPEGSSSF